MAKREKRVAIVADTAQHIGPWVAKALAERNIFAWSGHNYALELARVLDIEKSGGGVRIGPVHYNTLEELDVLIDALKQILA